MKKFLKWVGIISGGFMALTIIIVIIATIADPSVMDTVPEVKQEEAKQEATAEDKKVMPTETPKQTAEVKQEAPTPTETPVDKYATERSVMDTVAMVFVGLSEDLKSNDMYKIYKSANAAYSIFRQLDSEYKGKDKDLKEMLGYAKYIAITIKDYTDEQTNKKLSEVETAIRLLTNSMNLLKEKYER